MALRFYDLVVFIHVLSAIVLIGAGILATPTVNAAIRRASTIGELRRWLAVGKPLGVVNPVSSLALLASGVYLSSAGDWWGTPWVQLAVALWIVNSVMAGAVVKPAMKALAESAFTSERKVIDRELDRLRKAPRLALTHDVMIASDLAVLFLMVTKPTAYLGAILAWVAAQLISFATGPLRRRAPVETAEPALPLGG